MPCPTIQQAQLILQKGRWGYGEERSWVLITEELHDRVIRVITLYEHDKEICTESEWSEILYRLLVRIKRSCEKGPVKEMWAKRPTNSPMVIIDVVILAPKLRVFVLFSAVRSLNERASTRKDAHLNESLWSYFTPFHAQWWTPIWSRLHPTESRSLWNLFIRKDITMWPSYFSPSPSGNLSI